MTTQITTITTITTGTTSTTGTKSMRALIGATAASLAVLGGALLWQVRPATETAAPTAPATAASTAASTVSTVHEGVAPMGGLAEQYRESQRAQETWVTTAGGMAELYAQQQADGFASEAARMRALGGANAPYRASTPPTCGTVADGAPC